MKKMHTDAQIEEIAKGAGGGFDPSTIPEGDILQNAVLGLNEDGEAVKGSLFGKYVRVIAPPSSQTLTDEEVAIFMEGVFIKGNFMGYTNPVFMPCPNKVGLMIGADNSGNSVMICYFINNNNYISFRSNVILFSNSAQGVFLDGKSLRLLGKYYPAYPDNQTNKSFYLVLHNGTLEWHNGNGLYLHKVDFVTGTQSQHTLYFVTDSEDVAELTSTGGPNRVQFPNASFYVRVGGDNENLEGYGPTAFHPTLHQLSFPTGVTTVEYANIELVSIQTDTVTPL